MHETHLVNESSYKADNVLLSAPTTSMTLYIVPTKDRTVLIHNSTNAQASQLRSTSDATRAVNSLVE